MKEISTTLCRSSGSSLLQLQNCETETFCWFAENVLFLWICFKQILQEEKPNFYYLITLVSYA